MAVSKKFALGTPKCIAAYHVIMVLVLVHTSNATNLGLFAGDLKRQLNPFIIKKYSRHSPVFININPKLPVKSSLPPITVPKLPTKPPPFKPPKALSKLTSLAKPPRFPRLAAPIILPPLIPKLPLFPLLPLPLLPPVIPRLPILPLTILPRIPRIPKLLSPLKTLKPLKVPILGKKTLLQEAFGSESKPVITVPSPEMRRKENIIEKLLELKNRGSLTHAEYVRFKRLLL